MMGTAAICRLSHDGAITECNHNGEPFFMLTLPSAYLCLCPEKKLLVILLRYRDCCTVTGIHA